jgi:hypothetical protein
MSTTVEVRVAVRSSALGGTGVEVGTVGGTAVEVRVAVSGVALGGIGVEVRVAVPSAEPP